MSEHSHEPPRSGTPATPAGTPAAGQAPAEAPKFMGASSLGGNATVADWHGPLHSDFAALRRRWRRGQSGRD